MHGIESENFPKRSFKWSFNLKIQRCLFIHAFVNLFSVSLLSKTANYYQSNSTQPFDDWVPSPDQQIQKLTIRSDKKTTTKNILYMPEICLESLLF